MLLYGLLYNSYPSAKDLMDTRNIGIIAHVDHGKTTLVDFLLRQAGTFQSHEVDVDRAMDSMDLERERGITIAAKNASIRVGDIKINIVDTPGHADFGGEVERIMGMVDGALLLVDAVEGPLPQTRFVLEKALRTGLKLILVVNKVDRPEVTRELIEEQTHKIFDLFIDLGASDEQADFPIVYAVARAGWATTDIDALPDLLSGKRKGDLKVIYDLVRDIIPAPKVVDAGGFQMQVSNLAYSEYVGQLGIGRIMSGAVVKNQQIIRRTVDEHGKEKLQKFTVVRLYSYKGMAQYETDKIEAGDIGIVAGCDDIEIGDTIVANESIPALPRIKVEKPTLGMVFSVNTGPLSGQEGEAIQSRKLRERLLRECRTNVALRFEETEQPDQFRVLGRGELQFGILIEQMRREGYEFMVGRPVVLIKTEDGKKMEPLERAILDLPEDYASAVTEMFQKRKGILTGYENIATGSDGTTRVRLVFELPTRGLLGMQSAYKTTTRGLGLFSSELIGYIEHKGDIPQRNAGSLISDRDGEAVEYALKNLEDRGIMFIEPGNKLYEGMIIGEHTKENDLNINACREKKLTNVRASSAEILVHLQAARKMPLERCIEWIDDDEWIEVTPETIRLRKKILNQTQRNIKKKQS